MPVYQPKGTDRYVYDFQRKNKRYYGPCETTNYAEAKRVERKKVAEVEAGAGPDEASDMTIDAAAARWFDEHAQHLEAKVHYERSLDLVVRCIGARTKLREIDGPKVKDAMRLRKLIHAEYKSKSGVKTKAVGNATVNRQILEITRAVLRFSEISWGARNLQRIDWKKLRLPEKKHREREISDVEQKKLDDAARRTYWADFRKFLGTYGLRLGEMFFDPTDVYEVERQVSIRIKERKDGSTYVIDLDEEDGRLMLARKSRAEAAGLSVCWFREKRGKLEPLTYAAARSALRRLIKRSGVKDLTIHDHRHDVATKVTRGSGIAVAQAMLGHSDISTTKRYVRVSSKDRLAAIAAIKSREMSREDENTEAKPSENQSGVIG